jgi:hypothetical protein
MPNGIGTREKVVIGIGVVAVSAAALYKMLPQARQDAIYNATRATVHRCPLLGRLVTVSPTLAVAAPRAVLASMAARHRIAVQLGTDLPFDGTGGLTGVNADRVTLYEALVDGDPLSLPLDNIPGDRLSAGYTLYLECNAASAAIDDIGLTLTLQGGTCQLGPPATDQLTCVVPTLEVYRGTNLLQLVPFASTDIAAVLDGALPDDQQNVTAEARPEELAPAFTFPPLTEYGDIVEADADPALFRLRVKGTPAPIPDTFTAATLDATLRVQTGAGAPIDRAGTKQAHASTATHTGGMTVTLRKKDDAQEWVSPYLRVATTLSDDNNGGIQGIVHSLAPIDSTQMAHGLQLGRRLHVTCDVDGEPLARDVTLGGEPFARIPVKLFFVSANGPSNPKVQTARNKIFNLNQYWAGQGLEFSLVDPDTPLHRVSAPARTILSLGDFTGAAEVSDHNFTIELDLSITVQGEAAQTVTLTVGVAAHRSPAEVAGDIQAVLAGWVAPEEGPLVGLQLDADTYDIPAARVLLNVPALVLGPDPNSLALTELGTRGPADVVVKKASACGVNVTDLQITRLLVRSLASNPDTSIDIYAPPTLRPFHDAMFHPPSAATRHWVRSFSPPDKNFVSIVVESNQHWPLGNGGGFQRALCQSGFCSLYDATLDTMTGRFADPLRDLEHEGDRKHSRSSPSVCGQSWARSSPCSSRTRCSSWPRTTCSTRWATRSPTSTTPSTTPSGSTSPS